MKGKNLKELREKYGYTQEEVAKKLKVSKQTIFKYETDVITNIPSDKLEVLAEMYHTTPPQILGWDIKYMTMDQKIAAEITGLNSKGKEELSKYVGMLKGQKEFIGEDK